MVHVTKADVLLVPSARDTPMAQLQRQLIDFDSFGAHTILKTTAAITSVPGKKIVRLINGKRMQKDAKGDKEHTLQASCKFLIITATKAFS